MWKNWVRFLFRLRVIRDCCIVIIYENRWFQILLLLFYRNRPPLTTVAPQKHYRIVFIKAPTEAPATYPTIPLQPPDEEKTLVYVLVKKPDPPPELVLPKPVSTVPTKPEVYFIRYKTQVLPSFCISISFEIAWKLFLILFFWFSNTERGKWRTLSAVKFKSNDN